MQAKSRGPRIKSVKGNTEFKTKNGRGQSGGESTGKQSSTAINLKVGAAHCLRGQVFTGGVWLSFRDIGMM